MACRPNPIFFVDHLVDRDIWSSSLGGRACDVLRDGYGPYVQERDRKQGSVLSSGSDGFGAPYFFSRLGQRLAGSNEPRPCSNPELYPRLDSPIPRPNEPALRPDAESGFGKTSTNNATTSVFFYIFVQTPFASPLMIEAHTNPPRHTASEESNARPKRETSSPDSVSLTSLGSPRRWRRDSRSQTIRIFLPAILIALISFTALQGGDVRSANIPGYQLEAVWPADAHQLPAPNNLSVGVDNRIWLLDGPAGEAVALDPDGQVSERRPVPVDSLDLSVEPGGELYLGRWAGRPRQHYTVGRYLADGTPAWTRSGEYSATGTGIAATAGRGFYSDPERKSIRWYGRADGRTSGNLAPNGVQSGFPADIDVAPDGTLFASDLIGDAVYAWQPPYLPNDFDKWTMLESSGPFRIGVGEDADGDLLVAILFSEGLVRVHRPDGTLEARFFVPGKPEDLAVGKDGRLYILDADDFSISVYAPGVPPSATPPPPDPPRQPSSCTVQGIRKTDRQVVPRCDDIEVQIQFDADCPPEAVSGADIILLIDVSKSMDLQGRLDGARDAAKRFLAGLDFRYHQAAVVGFSRGATVNQALTSDPVSLDQAIDNLSTTIASNTNIFLGIDAATDHLLESGRPNALPVIVLLTDGDPDRPKVPEPSTAALVAAERARTKRAYIVTVGLGGFVDSLLLESIASSREDFYYAPSAIDLEKIYETILDVVSSLGLTDLVLRDTPSHPALRYIDGSGRPPPLVLDKTLQWTRPSLPQNGLAYTYTLKAHTPGKHAIGEAELRYLDADGTTRTFVFNAPEVEVILPTADPRTPMVTPSPGGPTPEATLPPPPTPASCADPYWLRVEGFVDSVGAGGYDCPGCNGLWEAGDYALSADLAASVLIRDASGTVLWLGDLASGRLGAPASRRIPLCGKAPFEIELARIPQGYATCPNRPALRVLEEDDFGPGRQKKLQFGLWHACGNPPPPMPSPIPPTVLPPCP